MLIASDAVGSFGWAVVAAAALSALLGGVGYAFASSRATKDRRRQLYSEAFRAATSWVEMLYRVRRRSESSQDAIVARLHEIYESIEFHKGWLSAEAPELGLSYGDLVQHIRDAVRMPMREAWDAPVRPPWEGTPKPADEPVPNLDEAKERYLEDIRDHLSWWWARRRVRRRYAERLVSSKRQMTRHEESGAISR